MSEEISVEDVRPKKSSGQAMWWVAAGIVALAAVLFVARQGSANKDREEVDISESEEADDGEVKAKPKDIRLRLHELLSSAQQDFRKRGKAEREGNEVGRRRYALSAKTKLRRFQALIAKAKDLGERDELAQQANRLLVDLNKDSHFSD